MQLKDKVFFIGTGAMGSALIKGVIESDVLDSNHIYAYDVDNDKLNLVIETYNINRVDSIEEGVKISDITIIAVKPQHIKGVLEEINKVVKSSNLVISIAAGIGLRVLEKYLPGTPVVRIMPNTPAQIGYGISAISPSSLVKKEDLEKVMKLFGSVGDTVIVDENLMDAVTGLSGSGPAYVFMIIEALSDAGVRMGLSRTISLKLAAYTVRGAAEMIIQTGQNPEVLKEMVTSPHGTTIEGVYALEKNRVRFALMEAVEYATIRSKELGEE
ncbi:MAG TPA: pyrroline-5-carboxylate reductase [Candidatus Atribacteria bacterium]|nr:pyrroline-5-carboxylate reductase [Candidatus Atribacteria bacterium]